MNFTRGINFSVVAASLVFLTSFREPAMSPSFDHLIQQDTTLKITLPKEGELVNGKPIGKNWNNLLVSLGDWNADKNYWKLENGSLHGDYPGGKLHNYAWTKKNFKDFELNAMVKLDGQNPNSGVCIRIHPVDADNVPGYQVDMGEGYWGCLWEEKRAGMVQKFPESAARKLVKDKDWNHYYVRAKGHHIEAWLNGVKTIDMVHAEGFEDGAIGFQLCHADHHTVLDVKSLYIRELK
jgi:hypothetical protein